MSCVMSPMHKTRVLTLKMSSLDNLDMHKKRTQALLYMGLRQLYRLSK